MTRVGKVLTWFGAAIIVISLAAGIPLAVVGFSKATETADRAYAINGPTTRHHEAGEKVVLYTPGTKDSAVEDDLPVCTVAGLGVAEQQSSRSGSFTFNNRTVTSFATYAINQTGDYTITCNTSYVVAAPEVSVSGILTGVGGVLLGAFGGGIGLLLLIVGIVFRVVGRRQVPPSAAQQPPGYGYPETSSGV